MKNLIQPHALLEFGLNNENAEQLSKKVNAILATSSPEKAWQQISKNVLTSQLPFSIHLFLFKQIFPNWPHELESAPAWIPDAEFIKTTHIARTLDTLNMNHFHEFHTWSVTHYEKFWDFIIDKLKIVFQKKSDAICDLKLGVESPNWLPGAKLNIAESCFAAPAEKTAIVFQSEQGSLQKLTYGELNQLSNQIANSLIHIGLRSGDPIAIDMPMTHFAVAIYLGIIKMGGVVVSIADSFSKDEITTRLRIAKTKALFTQDFILRDAKKLPLYEKVVEAQAPRTIVLPCEENVTVQLRSEDLDWQTFLVDNTQFQAQPCEPMDHCNILFSSGTTGEPKAIPWNHTTPIKVASDAYFHQNIQADDVLAWPTNLGWMMGPWLIFAALINHATIALYNGVPRNRPFGQFIEDARVTLLGVVPTLVASWRQSQCMEGLNWNEIRAFSSTGECSNPEDMLYLMSLAGYKPVIEYCGGTEIGGAYVTSTMVENNYPSAFTTPALGLDFILTDENGQKSETGEVALIPPSIGLSTELLNANPHQVYFANMPKSPDGKILRRHGDQLQQISDRLYCVLGRADDTMKLGGIKISSAEIERTVAGIDGIIETAAIAISPNGHGPSHLIIVAATQNKLDKESIKTQMQKKINQNLNPLFKIHDLVFVTELPKTASNKIMRRVLRTQLQETTS